jgi:uncharacterized protein RhaS with RHS repeats
MGHRVYLPTLGRFLQVDPIEGGTLNPYVYAHDPVNMDDYSGQGLFGSIINLVERVVIKVVALKVARNKPAVVNKVSTNNFYNSNSKNFLDILGFSKNNSQSGRGYSTPSQSEWDAYFKNKAGFPPNTYDQKDLNSWNNKAKENQKRQGQRNKQKDSRGDDDDTNNPTAPTNIGSNPYIESGGDGSILPEAVIIGGGVGLGVWGVVWWGAKVLSPLCGPAAPACAVAL